MPSESDGPLPAGRLPCSFHDVAIWIEALHADIVPLVPLLDDADAVRGEAVTKRENCVAAWKTDSRSGRSPAA